MCVTLVKGVHAAKHSFRLKVTARHKKQVSPFMISVLLET